MNPDGAPIACPVGTYKPLGGNACVDCPAGSYCPTPALVDKIECPMGHISGVKARYAENFDQKFSFCEPCPPGYFCATKL